MLQSGGNRKEREILYILTCPASLIIVLSLPTYYLMKSTNIEVPFYAIFSILILMLSNVLNLYFPPNVETKFHTNKNSREIIVLHILNPTLYPIYQKGLRSLKSSIYVLGLALIIN
jgi:hypothetical protein